MVSREKFPNIRPPTHLHQLLLSSYAVAHLACVDALHAEVMASTGRAAVEDISALLLLLSQPDQRLDGYVVLALAAAPESVEQRNFVRTFESERLVCRRHVIWPISASRDGRGPWSQRFDRVTIAALPENARVTAPTSVTQVPTELIQFIDRKMTEGIHWGPLADQLDQLARNRAKPPAQ
jgi:hypothetical protein